MSEIRAERLTLEEALAWTAALPNKTARQKAKLRRLVIDYHDALANGRLDVIAKIDRILSEPE